MAIRASHVFSSLLFACASLDAHAAELGDAQVRSYIGQPLAASVELAMIEDAAAQVGVRLAHPDVYRGANIAMPAVLSTLSMTVTRRDGRQFLHLSTLKPVESRHLHVYLELADGGQRGVRLVTLWLTPDPNPAPPPAPAVAPLAVAPAAVMAAPPARGEAQRRTQLPRKSASAMRPVAALHEGEEYVEEGARPAPAAAPSRQAVAKSPALAARKTPAKKVAPAAPAKPEGGPAACTPQPAAEQLKAYAALGEKNAALRHELGHLEAKVKVLQVAAGGASPAAPGAASASAPGPKGAARIQLKAKKAPPPEPETPWGLIGGALAASLALAGLIAALLRRRKPSTFGKIPKEHKPVKLPAAGKTPEPGAPDAAPKPSFMSSVKARLMPGSRKSPAPEPVEPAMENSES